MKNNPKRSAKAAAATRAAAPVKMRRYGIAAKVLGFTAAALILAFLVYSQSLNGPFLFDDTSLLFALPGFSAPLKVWLTNVRPALYFTYWINNQLSGVHTYSFHVVNVLIHGLTAGLIFMIV